MKTDKIGVIILQIIFFCIQELLSQAQQDSSWQYIGGQGISEGKGDRAVVAVTPDGAIYCAYRDYEHGQKISIKRFYGANWSHIPGSPGFSSCSAIPSMISSPAGEIYLAYSDSALSYKATVRKFNGNTWELVGGEGFTPLNVGDINLVLGPTGQLFIGFIEGPPLTFYHMSVMKFESGAWIFVGPQGSNDALQGNSMVVDSINHPYISFRGQNIPSIEIQYFNGTEWINFDLYPYNMGYCNSTCLAFDSSNSLNAAYLSSEFSGRVSVIHYDGINWNYLGPPGFTMYDSWLNKLVLSPFGQLHIGTSQNYYGGNASVMKYENNNWIDVGPFGFTDGYSTCMSLAFDLSGCPIVGVNEHLNDDKVSVMRFAPTPVSIEQVESKEPNVYPVPAQDKLFIDFDSHQEQILEISIIGMVNNIRLPIEKSQKHLIINTSTFPDGMYVIKILTNKKIVVKKFIKG